MHQRTLLEGARFGGMALSLCLALMATGCGEKPAVQQMEQQNRAANVPAAPEMTTAKGAEASASRAEQNAPAPAREDKDGIAFAQGAQSAPESRVPMDSEERALAKAAPSSFGSNMERRRSSSFQGSFGSGGRSAASSLHSYSSPPPNATYNPNMYLSNNYQGGTGARDRIERLVREGVMVDGRRVRLEAFPRNYAQSFAMPTQTALNVFAETERAKILTQGGRTYLQIGLQAIKGEAPRRLPLNIALVLDQSGSMDSENKMEQAKAAATELVNRLTPEDRFALVVFNDEAQTLVPAQPVTNRAALRTKIASIHAGGGTNIYDGLKRGYQEVRKFSAREGAHLVILLSDGQVTAGVADPKAFTDLAQEQVRRDIQTTSVGVGVEYNEDLMLAIAQQGQGNYHFLKDGADTRTVFAKEFDQLSHIVAKAIKLRIRLAEGVGFVRALGATQLTAEQTQQAKTEEKRLDRKVAEELGITANRQNAPEESGIKLLIPNFHRGDSHVVMLEVQVPLGQGARPIAEVSLKYKDLVFRANREARLSANMTYTSNQTEAIASLNRAVKKNLLGFQTGEALTQSSGLIAQGRVAEAVKRLDERMVVLGGAAKQWNDRDLDRDGALLSQYKTVLAHLNQNRQLAQGDFGQYLCKSLTYEGYRLTR